VLAQAKKAIAAGAPPGRRWRSADEILKGMDPALFREQRRCLLRLLEEARRDTAVPVSTLNRPGLRAVDADLLDGLDSLLDDLSDFSHDVLGLDCLLEEAGPEGEGGQ
jgi:hypothetical protein